MFTDAVRGEVRFHTDVIGDPVIVRADGTPAYNFAVVVDDALMAMTHVIRGEDHISNTPRQILLYEALGFTPPVFAHLSLVLGPDHSAAVEAARRDVGRRVPREGLPAGGARQLPGAHRLVAAIAGRGRRRRLELLPLDELARRFSLDAVGLSAGVFDEEKLAWVNRHYLKMADPARLAELSVPFFAAAGVAMTPTADGLAFLASVDADRVRRRSIGSIRCRRGSRSCSTTTPSARSPTPAVARGDARRRRARGRARRSPRCSRRRRGSIASASAPRPTR